MQILYESGFFKDLKKLKKQNYDLKLLYEVINLIATREPLPKQYKEHFLVGNWKRI